MPQDALRRLWRLIGAEGIAIYGERPRLRQDDLLVRSHAGQALGRAAGALRALAARYREERVPPLTREHPFAPKEALAALRALTARAQTVADAESALRSAPFPPEDAIWERLRSARLQLDLLLSVDAALIERAQDVERVCATLTPDGLDDPGSLQAVDRSVEGLRGALRERTELLVPPI